MTGSGICILYSADTCTSLVHQLFNPVAHYRFLRPTVNLVVVDIANPDLVVCGCRTWIYLDIAGICEEKCQPPIGSAWPA